MNFYLRLVFLYFLNWHLPCSFSFFFSYLSKFFLFLHMIQHRLFFLVVMIAFSKIINERIFKMIDSLQLFGTIGDFGRRELDNSSCNHTVRKLPFIMQCPFSIDGVLKIFFFFPLVARYQTFYFYFLNLGFFPFPTFPLGERVMKEMNERINQLFNQ